MVHTVVHVLCAVVSRKAKEALALIMCVVVEAGGTILARVELLAAEGNLALAVLT